MDFRTVNPLDLLNNPGKDISSDILIYFYILIFIYFIYKISMYILDRVSTETDVRIIYGRRRRFRLLAVVSGLLVSAPIFYDRIAYLPTILAFTGAGLIISVKDITLNIAGWFLIHGSSGFSVGDRVEVDGVKGDVVNIGLMRFTLLEVNTELDADQSTNRLVHIPNNATITQKIYVVSRQLDLVWDEVKIFLTFDSNWKKAKEISESILFNPDIVISYEKLIKERVLKLSKNFMLRVGKVTPIVYITLEDESVLLSLRYLTKVHEKRQHRNRISEKILESFKKHKDIHFNDRARKKYH